MARTIESPGVEITEIDLSNISTTAIGTNILLNGYAAQGPTDELLNISNIKEFGRIFGMPTTPAERYFYESANQILQSPGRLIVNRLPYGEGTGFGTSATRSALYYPVVPVLSGSSVAETSAFYDSDIDLAMGTPGASATIGFVLGAPVLIPNLSAWQVDEILDNTYYAGQTTWSSASAIALVNTALHDASVDTAALYELGKKSGMIILNSNYTNVEDNFAGYYMGVNDSSNISDLVYDKFKKLYTRDGDGSYSDLTELENQVTLNTKLTGTNLNNRGSISEIAEVSPTFSKTYGGADGLDYKYALEFSLWRAAESIDESLGNNVALRATYNVAPFIGSFDGNSIDTLNNPYGGVSTQSIFVEEAYKSVGARPWIDIRVNPMISNIMNAKKHFVRMWIDSDTLAADPVVTSVLPDDEEVTILTEYFNISSYPTITESISGGIAAASGEDVFTLSFAPTAWNTTMTVLSGTNDITTKIGSVVGSTLTLTELISGGAYEPFVDVTVEYTYQLIQAASSDTMLNAVVSIVNDHLGANGADGIFALGPYAPTKGAQDKVIGKTVSKLERGLALAENVDLYQLELVLDAGLSTINAVCNNITELSANNTFDDKISFPGITDGVGVQDWLVVYNLLNSFCQDTRKDCMCIVDPLRHIFVQGADSKVLDSKTKSFSQNILGPLKTLCNSCNSSYAATYANWVKAYSASEGVYYWAPFSAFEAAIMARVDALYHPWWAPAGLNNGIIRNIVDIAIEPNQRERDLLYRNGLNPITSFPRDGFVVFGQKTLQAKPSAFDRINVRRLFLFLEKSTRTLAKYFVFEPNTVFTRTRLINVLTPIFDMAKNNQGVYDYKIVCDERNNTPTVIDNNELVVDIYLKPVRTAEYILINFYATRTDANFEEIISGTGA